MEYYNADIMNPYKNFILIMLQIITIYNAIKLGWKVKKIDNRTFKLSKNINESFHQNFELGIFLKEIVNCNSDMHIE